MPVQTADLFLLEDLEDVHRTSVLAERELDALRATAKWIETFVARPHAEIGRSGTVCPFVPESLHRKTLWLLPDQLAGRSVPDVVQLVDGYKDVFLRADPVEGDDATYKSLVVVFTDGTADGAKGYFDAALKRLATQFYAKDGVVLGAFYETNDGTAIYNANFRPFRAPVPFLLLRCAVTSDWKFFLDDKDWLAIWARRFGESAVEALAEELRRVPWREADRARERTE